VNSDDLSLLSCKLTLDHLKRHPVWGSFEEDDSEIIRPVRSPEPFTVECDPLTIRTDFVTPCGRSLTGCVAVDRSDDKVYLVEIFVHETWYGFSIALPDLAQSQLEQLRVVLGGLHETIFPLTFRSSVKGPDGKPFSGVFSPFN